MADVYALLRNDAPMLFARKRGDAWRIEDKMPDVGPNGRKLCVFLQGTDVLGLQTIIPARNEAEARRAAPFAIEDEIGEAVETVHVALGPKPENPNTPRNLQVASLGAMTAWAEQLSALGLDDASLIASHSVLPAGNRLVSAGNHVLGRLGGRTFTLERDVGADVFLGLVDGHDQLAIHGRDLAAAMRLEAASDGVPNDESLLAQLATWAEGQALPDLRQGAFRPQRRVDLKNVKQWRVVGGLAAALGIGWFASVLLETNAMQALAAELDKRTVEFVNAGWPQAGGDPQRALAAQRGPQGDAPQAFPSALTAIAVLYQGVQSVEGAELRSVRYDRSRGQVAAVVAFDSFGGGDALTTAMAPSGLVIRAGDARQSGDKVVGEITLEAGS